MGHIKAENLEQNVYMEYLQDDNIICVLCKGAAGSGKAQPLYSKILTPTGWTTMGDIKIGDEVVGMDGKPAPVTEIFPQGTTETYRVTFSDGTYTDCCIDHLWVVKDSNDRDKNRDWKEMSLEDIIAIGTKTASGKRIFSIPVTKPIDEFRSIGKLPITQSPNEFTARIKKLGLMGKLANEKFIPKQYMLSNIDNRLELLNGLLDSDGEVNKSGCSVYFSSTSKQLIEDISFIVNSLGGVVKGGKPRRKSFSYKGEKRIGKESYQITISLPPEIELFKFGRKKELVKPKSKYLPSRFIDKIEYIGNIETKCIVVDNDSHTYLTDNLIVTHNTFLAIAYAYQAVLDGRFDEIVLARPYVAPSKKFQSGLLPGTLEEKMKPWMEVFYHNLDKIKTMTGKKGTNVKIKEQSLEHIKGQTFDRTIFILDEAEDFNVDEMSAILTRVGKYSKIVVLGDTDQATEKGCKLTLSNIIKKFREVKASDKEKCMFASVELQTSLRSEFVNFVLKVFK
jgi:hypothetical protein